ncbi:lasso RiPP family leader peptide-containing protein [Actinomadura sp. 9N407]
MERKTSVYEPPTLAEVGGFAQLTLKQGTWGWDSKDECLVIC